MLIEKGTKAPDFELAAGPDKTIKLADYKDKKLILVFYPADWSPVCSDELAIFNESMKLFEKYNASVLGISVDGKWCHAAFKKERNLKFPLLADFEPKGAVSKKYNSYNNEKGVSKRSLFVIDGSGTVQWSYLSPDRENPGVAGVLDALDELENANNLQHEQTQNADRRN